MRCCFKEKKQWNNFFLDTTKTQRLQTQDTVKSLLPTIKHHSKTCWKQLMAMVETLDGGLLTGPIICQTSIHLHLSFSGLCDMDAK